ncbi:HlyD family secretion protein [Teichococcus oryzae]|uniref:HlyD family secretion protein n=1 Tax=Teichococcus oryzae TaxID=1608942 RepID=A0A5B2TFC1_9PROT|nr:HlyD family secretion protein [Pseudoroseomonas oryzae]KAA2212824.1 HlyD family secretion protein [Pseudoroseomonas oryzae]
MLELLVCSLLTIFPDYLYRRYAQGKRIGREITLFSVWFELRWGIVSCLLLTVSLITLIFYYHPATQYVTAVFRSVPIISESVGRVAEIYVRGSERVEAGQPLFRLEDSTQRTAVETARRAIAEVDAAVALARADLAASDARILEAQGALQQAQDEYATKAELNRSAPNVVVARRELERIAVLVQTRQAGVAAARAARQVVEARLAEQLPAQHASAVAAMEEADAALAKTVVRAGVTGRVEQFLLQVGDIVNPILRPAGVLVPEGRGLRQIGLAAGFGQIEAQVMRAGMPAEATCASLPWTIIPMVVTNVQGYIASGQIRSTDQLLELQQFRQPGTILVTLEPLYEGGLDGVVPGSSCIANAYTTNHEKLSDPRISSGKWVALHVIDAVGLVHAILLRIQAVLLPFKTLVLGGH